MMCSHGHPLLPRVTLLDLMIAKLVSDEQLTKDEISVFLHHAELIASSFVDQCRSVLKLTSEQHAEDEVRTRLTVPARTLVAVRSYQIIQK